MIKRIVILFILVPAALLLANSDFIAASAFKAPIAVSMLLAEVDSEEILFDYNMSLRHPADSLTKVMTLLLAITAIENGTAFEDELIEMTDSAWAGVLESDSTLKIMPGEKMPLLDLLYSAFFGKAGEACNMIALHIGGSVENFVEMMNQHAMELGCETTNFTNTHGKYDENQYTSARDQFLIFRDAISKPLFVEITGVYRHAIDRTNMSEPRRLVNSNSLLNTSGKYYFRQCTSGIASVSFEGGHSFVGSAESDGLSLIAIVLGSDEVVNEDDSVDMHNLTEARRLFAWGYTEFGWHTILSSSELVAKAPILHGAGADSVNLRPEASITLLIGNDIPLEEFKRDITIYSEDKGETLVAPIKAGDVLGEITLSRNGKEFGPILLVANTSIELHRFEYIRIQVNELMSTSTARYVIWGLAILIAGYAALVIRYNVIRRKRLNRIAQAKRKLAEERMGSSPDDEYRRFREFTEDYDDRDVREDSRLRSDSRSREDTWPRESSKSRDDSRYRDDSRSRDDSRTRSGTQPPPGNPARMQPPRPGPRK